jgi:hypothetical protein
VISEKVKLLLFATFSIFAITLEGKNAKEKHMESEKEKELVALSVSSLKKRG